MVSCKYRLRSMKASASYKLNKNCLVTSNEPLAKRSQKSKYCDASVSFKGMSLIIRNDTNGML